MDDARVGGIADRSGRGADRARFGRPRRDFYFFTVVIMWLIHVGFMMYEAGAARRKNIMSTAMKNILTIAVVTPTFYYFGWYIYGCFQHGGPAEGHAGPPSSPASAAPPRPGRPDGAEPRRTTSTSSSSSPSCSSRGRPARSCRERSSSASASPRTCCSRCSSARPSGSWTPPGAGAAAAGSSPTTASTTRSRRSSCTASPGAFTLGVLLNLGPRIGKYDREGGARSFRPHNTHMTLIGADAHLHGVLRLLRRLPRDHRRRPSPAGSTSTCHPTTLGTIAMVITIGFAGGFTGGWFASKGDPFWTLSGGLAGVITVSAGADVYHPSLAYILAIWGGMLAVWVGNYIEKRLRVDDAVGAVAVHGFCGFLGVFLVGIFAGGFPTGVNNVPSSFGGQLMGMLAFFPLAFLPGFIAQLDPEEDEPAARAARGRARGPRHGRVPAGLLPRVREAARATSSSPTARRSRRRRSCSRATRTSRTAGQAPAQGRKGVMPR